jgi:DNA-binding NtrC family response regulator
MSTALLKPQGRVYTELLGAMNELLAVLSQDGDQEAALRASFEAAALGFGAQKALLLLVEEREPLRLRAVHFLGLTREQAEACERRESVRGVSPSVIYRVIETGKPELIEAPLLRTDPSWTPSLEGDHFSVLCAPICDPDLLSEAVLAVVYFQNSGLTEAYGEDDRTWLEGYATIVGRICGFHLQKERRKRELREAAAASDDAPEILGVSAHIQALLRALHGTHIPALAVENPEPVLILGERGTGKDLIARYLHACSQRKRRPLVIVNCAEITDELAASRFFGHKKGSFTGALTDEPGFFRAANGGVLFLDEVAELSLRAQALLLRVLESHVVTPVGETREIPVDVAVILATNRDLAEAAQARTLREDFYDRFRTLAIRLLPLRERPWGDIPLLLDHFRRHHEVKYSKRTLGFTQEAQRALASYNWPGNVREISRVCALFVIHAQPGAQIDRAFIESIYPDIVHPPSNLEVGLLSEGTTMHDALRAFQRELIQSRLEIHGGHVKAAAESLGLSKATMYRLMKSLGITRGELADD